MIILKYLHNEIQSQASAGSWLPATVMCGQILLHIIYTSSICVSLCCVHIDLSQVFLALCDAVNNYTVVIIVMLSAGTCLSTCDVTD